ncbi:MAG TPA: fibrobacter succinogenes major paralogous domain-containing protein [Bacteroidales bacterium]|nr:fibrobacter succinogenes major paralogous domain-containing protein [Bacteroidales bacterium]
MKKLSLFLVLFSTLTSILMTDCKKDPVPPTLTTAGVTEITVNSAKTGGNITDDGGSGVTERGVAYGLSPEPAVADNHVSAGDGSGDFTVELKNLTEATLYYVRAYATNAAGTSYGNQETFTTAAVTLAAVTTKVVSGITFTTAVSGGDIQNNGGADVTAKGICWSTTENPTIENSKTTDGTGNESFNSNLIGLTENTTYYVRAYATNSKGTAYGNQQAFSTPAISLATIDTKAVSEVTAQTAVSGGAISSDGGTQITAKGICFSTTENPTIESAHTTDGAGLDPFNSNMTGLMPGTTYYVRAYVTNVKGTAYGTQVSFTTAPGVATLTTKPVTEITFTTAKSGGDVLSNGGSAVTAKGICWNTAENPTIQNNFTTDGTGNEGFVSSLSGLSTGTVYYVRAYATNGAGTSYGNQVTFTSAAIGVPAVVTKPVTAITFTTALSGGEISNDGGAAVTAKGICWGTAENPTIENSHTSAGSGNESFDGNMTGLTDGTVYYVRAYATNSIGTAYGNQVFFTTTAASLPTVATKPVTELLPFSAKSGGEISADGGAAVTAKGICWSTTENPTIEGSHTTNGTGSASFDSNMTGLHDSTTYYVRAYATNKVGTGYGPQVKFMTPPSSSPILTTTAVTSLTSTTAVTGGTISSDGGLPVTQRGVVWGLTPNPTTAGSRTTNGTGSGVFTSNVTGLTNGTVYYVRAYATNSKGTTYGNEISFITPVTDLEGNVYRTVKIGDQIWMAENLKATRFRNNTAIPLVTGTADWIALDTVATPAYSWYNNSTANKNVYGGIYNWYAVATGNLCPTGWHVPTELEFQTLERTVGIPVDSLNTWGWRGNNVGTHMKNTTGWTGGNGDNTSGFSVLPAGYRAWADGTFRGAGVIVYLWLASDDAINHKPEQAWYRRFDSTDTRVYKATTHKGGGKSIRCLKD